MTSRRDIITGALLAGVAAVAAPLRAAARRARRVTAMRWQDGPVVRLGGLGDGYKMSVARDGRQLVVVNDGPGWTDPPRAFYNSRLWTLEGTPDAPTFREVATYPDLDMATRPEDAPRYHGHGIVAAKGRIYQFLSTLDRAEDRPRHWTGAKLIWSDDDGRSWHNQDGSSPVRFEDWNEQSADTLAFFNAPDGCFSLLSIAQMGRDYSANRDGYLYVYGLNGNVDGKMNELLLFRAPVGRLEDRGTYEYFSGHGANGAARWSREIGARAVVHRFPAGRVNSVNLFPGDLVVESWLPSVAYNEALGLYMMASAGIGVGPDGTEFGTTSYFGLWVADAPWGPWRQVHEDRDWTPDGDREARAYAPQIAPGWIAADGRSLWIVWADVKGIRAFGRDEALLAAALEQAQGPQEHSRIEVDFLRRYMPGFAFNAQRIELVLA